MKQIKTKHMDVQYFINKFEAIPEEKWCIGSLYNISGQSCANGHCGLNWNNYDTELDENGIERSSLILTEEAKALYHVTKDLIVTIPEHYNNHGREYAHKVAAINNGNASEYQQDSPKQRVLAALRDIQIEEQLNKAVEQTKKVLSQPIAELV